MLLETKQSPAVNGVRRWVSSNIGLVYDADQATMLDARIEVVCKKLKITIDALLQRLVGGDHEAAVTIAEEMSTNHTFFFREPETFDFLRKEIVQSLPRQGPLRVWSAAASSGEEAFSLGICLFDELGGLAARDRVRILGTDISQRQIRRAESGLYPPRSLDTVSPSLRGHFAAAGPEVRVREHITSLCTFRRLNLTQQTWPFQARFHLVFLRNVLYYFDPPTRALVLERCFDACEPGAWLVTSLTEPLFDVPPRWIPVRPGMFRKPKGG